MAIPTALPLSGGWSAFSAGPRLGLTPAASRFMHLLAERWPTSGEEYQPPAVAELEDLLGSDSFKQLTENPRIKQAVQVWANSSAEDRAAVTKSLATLIADEVGQPSLEKRIAWE